MIISSKEGPIGPRGLSVLNGSADPTSGVGLDGEFWINTSTWKIFGPKAGGAWPAGVPITGGVAPTLGALTFSSTAFVTGTAANGTIIGATTGSLLTDIGRPTGLTINSAARTWAWAGSTGSSGSFSLIETLVGAIGSARTSTINYTISVGSGGSVAVNTAPPTITGTRGGTLTAVPGTWTGTTSIAGLWYADGVATSNTSLSFTDSDTTKTIEYRETAQPGSVTASGYRGTSTTAADFFDDFNSYADGTRLAERYTSGSITNFVATATPHVTGWDFMGYNESGDTNVTGEAQNLRIYSGKVKQNTQAFTGGSPYVVKNFGSPSGVWDITLSYDNTAVNNRRYFNFSTSFPSIYVAPNGLYLEINGDSGAQTISLSADGVSLASITALPGQTDGDVLRVKIDSTAQRVWLFYNGTAIGNSAGYDLSGKIATYTNLAGVFNGGGYLPTVGQSIFTSLSYNSLASNSVSAALGDQASGAPGKKKIDVTATIGVTGATGAEYKIETEAGQLLQTWTAMTYSAGTGTATFNVPDFVGQGQKFRALIRNVGGTAKITATLTATNPYVLQQQMRVGMNDNSPYYASYDLYGRDIMDNVEIQVGPLYGSGSAAHIVISTGETIDNYGHWAENYSPTQNYPDVLNGEQYARCVYNGVQWARTSGTVRSGVAPNPAEHTGATSGWSRLGYALGSVVGMRANDWPSNIPADANTTLVFVLPMRNFAFSRYPVTVNCKTEPGVNLTATGNCTMSGQNLTTGAFTLTITSNDGIPFLFVDRATPISSAFFLSGVPTYETGTPALDIGAPYVCKDKLVDFAPYYGVRNMGGAYINRRSGEGKWDFTAANVPTGGRRQWQLECDMANQNAHKIVWVNIPDQANDAYITAMANYYHANLNSTVTPIVEFSNECWNYFFLQTVNLATAATAAGLTLGQMYGRKFKHVTDLWKAAWGADAARVKGAVCWQSNAATVDVATILNQDNAYLNCNYFAIAPYFNGQTGGLELGLYADTPVNVRNAVIANDFATFTSLVNALMPASIDEIVARFKGFYDWLPGYSVSKGLSKDAIGMASYEGGPSPAVNTAAWDAGAGTGMGLRAGTFFQNYLRSAAFATLEASYVTKLATKAPHLQMQFQMYGPFSLGAGLQQGYGKMDRTGNRTDQPYATLATQAATYNA